MRKTCEVLLVIVGLALVGCATAGSYSRIPSRFTTLSPAPNSESYLIELIRAAGEPTAARYEFTAENGLVTGQVSTISRSGARSERRLTTEAARKILQIFRGFDWGAIDAPLPDEDATVSVPDNTDVVFKARTTKSYREVQVRLSDCAPVRRLLHAIESAK